MMSEFETRLRAVDQVILTPIVQRLLDRDLLTLIDWGYTPVEGGSAKAVGPGLGLYRFFGHADVFGETLPWSVILKAYHVAKAAEGSVASGNELEASWNYWKREALAYASGLLSGLSGGLVAPRCFGVFEYPNEVWIWLEEIHETSAKKWPIERFGIAARHLGEFNGRYLAGYPLPAELWLSKGRITAYLQDSAQFMAGLRNLAQHPVVGRWLTADHIERILRLWADREQFLQAFDRLPRCLCHHDAYRRNLLARRDPHGREQTVAIDWAILGVGTVGEELAMLVPGSLRWLDADIKDAAVLDAVAFNSYLAGLRDAGWDGDETLVRFGYTTAATYFNAVGGLVFLPFVADEHYHPLLEQVIGGSLEQILTQWNGLQGRLLDLSDEMRQLYRILLFTGHLRPGYPPA